MLSFLFSFGFSFVIYTLWGEVIIFMLMLMMLVSLKFNELSSFLEVNYYLDLDLFSSILIMLSIWVVLLCVLGSIKISNSNFKKDFFLFMFLLLDWVLILTFMSSQFLLFYSGFEVCLFPVLFLILGFGYQPERIQAGVYMFFYTLLGSLPLLFVIMFLIEKLGSDYMMMIYLLNHKVLLYMFSLFMLSAFLVKFPMYMFHLWLLKAHVEAPVSGSMILAGVMLKLGGYGLLRFFIFLDFMPLLLNEVVIGISLWGAFFVSLNCLRYINMKMLIASSSIVHMALSLIGLMVVNSWGLKGFFLLMIAHGLCSSGLFYMVNVVYERTHSQSLFVSKGLLNLMPVMSLWWFLLLMGNMAAPPSINLLSELMLIISLLIWKKSFFLLLLFLSFFSASYNFYIFSLSQHGKYIYNKYSFNSGLVLEYVVVMLHWLPINLLILVSYLLI